MPKIYFSKLPKDQLLSCDIDSYPITAEELLYRLKYEKEESEEKWYIAEEKTWTPNVQHMIESYIEAQYDEIGMYEDWDEKALDSIKDHHIETIQKILESAFEDSYANKYWIVTDTEVVIDLAFED